MRDSVCVPLSTIFQHRPLQLIHDKVQEILPASREIRLRTHGLLPYDFLILALGAQTENFQIPGGEAYTYGLKTLAEAIALRAHIVACFLRARELDRKGQREYLTFVVVGGGATGVEIAGELASFLRRLTQLHPVDVVPQIWLVEAGERILRELPAALALAAQRRLEKWQVNVQCKRPLTRVYLHGAEFAEEIFLPTRTVIWAGGIRTHDVILRSALPAERRTGLKVLPTLQVNGWPNIFAAGDCADVREPTSSRAMPATAQEAEAQGKQAAENVLRLLRGEKLKPYLPQPRPLVITVGGRWAVAHFPRRGWELSGRLAWALKQLISLRHWLKFLPFLLACRVWLRSVRVYLRND
jgi:NADH dehydrogenase